MLVASYWLLPERLSQRMAVSIGVTGCASRGFESQVIGYLVMLERVTTTTTNTAPCSLCMHNRKVLNWQTTWHMACWNLIITCPPRIDRSNRRMNWNSHGSVRHVLKANIRSMVHDTACQPPHMNRHIRAISGQAVLTHELLIS